MARFAQGRFRCKNPEKYIGGSTPLYRSSWEFTMMRFCDEHPSITQWVSEGIKIPYINPLTGKKTVYVPDFLIQFSDKTGKVRTELIEVKPANQTLQEKIGRSRNNQAHYALNQAKWAAAKMWCKKQGIIFRVITENDIFHYGARR